MSAAFKKRRNMLVDGLNAIDGISCILPGGAFYAFANVSKLFGRKHKGKPIKGSFELSTLLLEDASVALVPGVAFGDDNFVRLSYACSEENIRKGLDRIAAFVKQLEK